MEMLLFDKQTDTDRESPIRKKGRPTNLDETMFSDQHQTPTRSNRKNEDDPLEDTTMMDIAEEEAPMGPYLDATQYATTHGTNSTSKDNSIDLESLDAEWVTKTSKKTKKVPKMTQTKLVDMMMHGGYGQPAPSPPRKDHNTRSPQRMDKQTPPRAGRGTPPRSSPTTGHDKLSSTRSGHSEPQGRET